jgi:DNA-binding beta-propeller fold protein YncE
MHTKLAAATKTILRRALPPAIPLTLLFALLCTTGCKNFFVPVNGTGGTGTTPTNTGDYAYVVSVNTASSSDPIYSLTGFSIGSGKLTELTGFPLIMPFPPSTAVVTPSNALLYVCGSEVLYGYTISSAGALTSILNTNQSQALVNANISQMVVSPDGNWLLGLDQTPNGSIVTIHEYGIGSTGQLTTENPVQYSLIGGATATPASIAISPANNYVAVALGNGGDVLFSFATSTGTLTEVAQENPPTSTSADQAVAFDAKGTTLYVARSGTDGGVIPYVIGTSNSVTTLTAAAGAPFATGAGPASILIDSTGKYLYVANKVDSTISGFSIGTGGVLTALAGSPFTAGTNPDTLAEDNSGKYILSTSLGAPDLKMFSFDTTIAGALDASTTASTGDPTEPAGAVAIALTH